MGKRILTMLLRWMTSDLFIFMNILLSKRLFHLSPLYTVQYSIFRLLFFLIKGERLLKEQNISSQPSIIEH